MKFSFCFVPVELGLEFLLTARIGWLENETKVKVKTLLVKEFQFDTFDKSILYPNPDLKMLGDVKLDSE